jgi:FtsZ-interacting cell division protein ZipA
MSNVTLLIIILVVATVVVGLLVAFISRRRQRGRQERARQEFGSEYEHAVEEHGSEREAEQELRERRERVESEVQPLSEESRRRYDDWWRRVEQTFVDDPEASLQNADRVVMEIMTERNFPMDTQQEVSKGIGVIYPEVVEDFREAQRTHQDAIDPQRGMDLEKMRQAIQKYRSVYQRLTER